MFFTLIILEFVWLFIILIDSILNFTFLILSNKNRKLKAFY
jgi:hypothetical protein